MALRILTAVVGIPVLVGAIWAGFPWITVLVGITALVALVEFYGMAHELPVRFIYPIGALATILFVVSGQLADEWYDYTPHMLLGIGILLALPLLLLYRDKPRDIVAWGYAVGGPIYVGFLLAHALMLRELDGLPDVGRDWLLFTLLATFATDTGAFLAGRTLGRHQMAPSISPNKTWEGSFGGFTLAVCIAVALDPLLQLSVPIWQTALCGAAIGVVAQIGDLAESRFKRARGIKDTGRILPGHGGLLDRLDSIVFTVPLMYYLVALALKPSS